MRRDDGVHARDDLRAAAGRADIHFVSPGRGADRGPACLQRLCNGLLSAGVGVRRVRLFILRLQFVRQCVLRCAAWLRFMRICPAGLFGLRRGNHRAGAGLCGGDSNDKLPGFDRRGSD